MHPCSLEEMTWAIAREREQEARQLQARAQANGSQPRGLRSGLARGLATAALRLDPAASKSVLAGHGANR